MLTFICKFNMFHARDLTNKRTLSSLRDISHASVEVMSSRKVTPEVGDLAVTDSLRGRYVSEGVERQYERKLEHIRF